MTLQLQLSMRKIKNYSMYLVHILLKQNIRLTNVEVPFSHEYESMEDNIIYGNTKENLAETFKWAGYDDADSKGGYSLWAPDVIWNADYEWSNGDKGAYMLYYSASSTWRRSAIGLAVAKQLKDHTAILTQLFILDLQKRFNGW